MRNEVTFIFSGLKEDWKQIPRRAEALLVMTIRQFAAVHRNVRSSG